jgi:hypothetical protein
MRFFGVVIVALEKQQCLLRNVELQVVNFFFVWRVTVYLDLKTTTSADYVAVVIIPAFFENIATIQFLTITSYVDIEDSLYNTYKE